MRHVYPCILEPEDEGGFFVRFPDVSEVLTGGANRAEALALAEDCLTTALGSYVQNHEPVPLPSPPRNGAVPVTVPAVVAAKLDLHAAMRRQRLSKKDLASRLRTTGSAVSRLTDPRCRSHIHRVEEALRAVGRQLVIESRALERVRLLPPGR